MLSRYILIEVVFFGSQKFIQYSRITSEKLSKHGRIRDIYQIDYRNLVISSKLILVQSEISIIYKQHFYTIMIKVSKKNSNTFVLNVEILKYF